MLVENVDFFRIDANRKLEPGRRSELGQYMTPPSTARFMASMFEIETENITLLDAGAGVGSLTAAFVDEIRLRVQKPKNISVTAYEIDGELADYLATTLTHCGTSCNKEGITFASQLLQHDFIDESVKKFRQELYTPIEHFTCAIVNPPYRKINSDSETRLKLREIGIETSNLYTAFLSLIVMMLAPGGEMVAITPRSFCNGPYFKSFRKKLLDSVVLKGIHIFESRNIAFKEDEVLQENVILHVVKDRNKSGKFVTVSSSYGPEDELFTVREIPYEEVVHSEDPESFIYIAPDESDAFVVESIQALQTNLQDLGIEVSTGRVVDFRATAFLKEKPEAGDMPLIYPANFKDGYICWPRANSKKSQALTVLSGVDELLVPQGTYVLVKRFTSKDEDRRIVAAIYDPERIKASHIGFENHTNYYHSNGNGLPLSLAKGLALFLNSTLVDVYFRQFNGHTQVNATDLRNLRYPTAAQLEKIGSQFSDVFPDQQTIDEIVEREIFKVLPKKRSKSKKRIEEALSILSELGLPREQQNERSALTLLALVALEPDMPWLKASSPLMGITPMMEYFTSHYKKKYAPNTRETVRRQTIHQFLDAGFVSLNPDEPSRPTNSPYSVYQIESGLLELLRQFDTPQWQASLETYLASIETLKKKYAQERHMKRIPIKVAPEKTISLSPGGQNILIEKIIQDFCQLFTGGGKLLYVGDAGEKWIYFEETALKEIGVTIEAHGKMPDVIVHVEEKNWLVLIEAVTSHGPVNPKRRGELKALFKNSHAGLVFVTAFLDRKAMTKHLSDISWETEVWVADTPEHLIHFNGERFLGPYEG